MKLVDGATICLFFEETNDVDAVLRVFSQQKERTVLTHVLDV